MILENMAITPMGRMIEGIVMGATLVLSIINYVFIVKIWRKLE